MRRRERKTINEQALQKTEDVEDKDRNRERRNEEELQEELRIQEERGKRKKK